MSTGFLLNVILLGIMKICRHCFRQRFGFKEANIWTNDEPDVLSIYTAIGHKELDRSDRSEKSRCMYVVDDQTDVRILETWSSYLYQSETEHAYDILAKFKYTGSFNGTPRYIPDVSWVASFLIAMVRYWLQYYVAKWRRNIYQHVSIYRYHFFPYL